MISTFELHLGQENFTNTFLKHIHDLLLIVSLLHDIIKAENYLSFKNEKN